MPNEHSTLNSSAETDLDRCHAYITYQLEERKRPPSRGRCPPPGPAITIAYETGSGAHEIARQLVEVLHGADPKGSGPWTLFDRQLVEEVLEDHHLPKRLAKFLPEERRSYIRDVMEEFLGVRPPSWVVEPLVAESVLHLADAGHVILVGRGASVITARMPNVFHVRLVASLQRRIERVQKSNHLTRAEAGRFIAKSDRGRNRYVKAYFHGRPDNELLYHLIVNTDLIALPEAAELIAAGARSCFRNAEQGKA